jgi:ATP-dependent protease ClpP protease subunit
MENRAAFQERKVQRMKSLVIAIIVFMFTVGVGFSEDSSKVDDRIINLQERELQLEREKFEYEKSEKARAEYESRFSASSDTKQEIPIFKITSSITQYEITNLRNDLRLLYAEGHRVIIILISSGGGDAFTGLGIADVIDLYEKKGVTFLMRAYSIVASAAIPIFASGSERVCTPSTLFMVHEASLFKYGLFRETHSDIKSQNAMMDMLRDSYLKNLAANSSRTYEFWANLEGNTTWFTAEQALEWGLVDLIE